MARGAAGTPGCRREPGQQHLAREGGRHRYAQPPHLRFGLAAGHLLQRRNGLAHAGQVGHAVGAQAEVVAREELEFELRLELADAMADRAGRHAEFFGREVHAAQPCDGLEGLQALCRGESH
jgi:hypothetical protein